MRIVFMGSGAFGLPVLEALAAGRHELAAVVSQPDRPAGRGGKTRPTPVSARAAELSLPLLCPEQPNTPAFADEFGRLAPDLVVIVAYGHLIRQPLLGVPRLGFINLHASLLPAYRGAAPVPWAILQGETESGATVFALDTRFDTGRIIGQVRVPITADDTSQTYLEKLSHPGAELMLQCVEQLDAGTARYEPQDEALATRAPKFRKEDGLVDWSAPLAQIDCRVRAFQPWPLAFSHVPTAKGLVRINVLRVSRASGAGGSAAPGSIVAADGKNGLVFMAGDGPVRVCVLQPEGKRPMQDTDYLRGSKIAL